MESELEKYVRGKLVREFFEVLNSFRNTYELPLSSYERTIIYKYTEDGYEGLNSSLRRGEELPLFGKLLYYCLNRLPDYQGLCYRAIKCSKSALEKYYAAFKNGSTITERSFLSCSKSKLLALQFSHSPLFIIYSRKGKDIEKVAKFGEGSGQNEKEILFRNNSKFKVLDISEENQRITIILEEV